MTWFAINSSEISYVAYDHEARSLWVTFHEGGIYRYIDVSRETFTALMSASSKGKYFWSHIRERYMWEKVA